MPKDNKNSELKHKNAVLVPGVRVMEQACLFQVEKQIEYDGVEMGVLENGMPYLSENGLARMCGVDRKAINRLSENWETEKTKPRGKQINELLIKSGYTESKLYIESKFNNQDVHAYTEDVCFALLEYYAFISDEKRPEAIKAFRTLARRTFRDFVYTATKYSPEQRRIESWKNLHDRVDMTAMSVPDGYFGIFHEMAAMIVPMINSGVYISDKVVPDISAGQVWAKHWKDNKFDDVYGARVRYEHRYPEYYAQAASNPQLAYAYPEEALGLFRRWLRDNYIKNKFPKYIFSKIKDLSISSKDGRLALAAFSKKPEIPART